MSKRISTAKGDFSAQTAGENMRKYLSEKNYTRRKMAEEVCGIDRRIVSAIAAGKDCAYNASTFELISERTGIGASYWKGLITTPITLDEEKERSCAEQRMTELEERQHKAAALRYNNLRAFFAMLGYEYTPFEDTTGEPQTIHQLRKGDSAYFEEAELEALLSKIAELVEFECYRQRKRHPQNEETT